MPTFQVSSSIDINVPVSRARNAIADFNTWPIWSPWLIIADFNTWPIWSPWLIMDRECQLSYQGTAGEIGHGYDWEGQKIGAGGMVMTSLDENRMEAQLQFLKPWKSKADIAFDFQALADEQTRVDWHMDSSLPFFMFFMLGKMKAMIKGDYDRGLSMFKDYLENGSVPSGTNVEGVVDVPKALYAGKLYHSSMADIGDSMGSAFPEVFHAATDAGADITGMPFSIYNNMDIVKTSCSYTAAVPIAESIKLPTGFKCDERVACKALKVVHTGPYRHLGNAWSTGMNDMRHAKMKMDKKNPPFEVYVNDPEKTAEESLITEIYIPVRG